MYRRSAERRVRWFRSLAMGSLLALILSSSACESDATTPIAASEDVSATVIGPEGIGAAVVAFTGVASVRVVGGTAYTRRTGSVLQAVLVPQDPGALEIFVTPEDPAVAPAAVLLDLVNGDYDTPASLEAYDVVFGS